MISPQSKSWMMRCLAVYKAGYPSFLGDISVQDNYTWLLRYQYSYRSYSGFTISLSKWHGLSLEFLGSFHHHHSGVIEPQNIFYGAVVSTTLHHQRAKCTGSIVAGFESRIENQYPRTMLRIFDTFPRSLAVVVLFCRSIRS